MAWAGEVDEGGSSTATRGLDRGEALLWYAVAATSYVAASILQKSLLNWFVGPLWLVAVVWFGPIVSDRFRRIGRRR